MPTVTRMRSVPAEVDTVWGMVSDPERLPEWWPGVQRVEEATPGAWTSVMAAPKGKAVRADHTRLDAQRGRHLRWRHELEGSPFERILRESVTEIELKAVASASTEVRLTVCHRPRGLAHFGFVQMRLATARQVEGALDGLERLVGRSER